MKCDLCLGSLGEDDDGLCKSCDDWADLSEEGTWTFRMLASLPPLWSKWGDDQMESPGPLRLPGRILCPGDTLPGLSSKKCAGCLLIGDLDDVKDLSVSNGATQVTHVYNCCPERMGQAGYMSLSEDLAAKGILHVLAPMHDNMSYDPIEFFKRSLIGECLVSQLRQGCWILVNCWAGCNRSACLCIYAMLLMGFSMKDAYMRVREVRGHILQNRTFCLRLVREYEEIRASMSCES